MKRTGEDAQAWMRTVFWTLTAFAACLLVWSCDVAESGKEKQFISLRIPDSLMAYDSVFISLHPVGATDASDTLWHDSISDPAALAKLPTKRYPGGDADIVIRGFRNGHMVYEVRVEYRANAKKPNIVSTLARDSLAPSMAWSGPDSLELDSLADAGALTALLPKVTCLDDRDRGIRYANLEIRNDAEHEAIRLAAFVCLDHAGNKSPEKVCIINVRSLRDTLPPVISLRGPKEQTVKAGAARVDPGADCADAHDGALAVKVEEGLDPQKRGVAQIVSYSCRDRAGNSAGIDRTVTFLGDGVKPVLSRSGPDTLVVLEGKVFADSAIVCVDDLDSSPAITVSGAVDTGRRGTQVLTYHCIDSSGNEADTLVRNVRVIRVPDPVAPTLTLIGKPAITLPEGRAYEDSGAACQDDRDGKLPITQTIVGNPAARGIFKVKFACADSAGNPAGAEREVTVIRLPDPVKPVLKLRGSDSVVIYDHQDYMDSGADCTDDRDGPLEAFLVSGQVLTLIRGTYDLTFHCTDSAGNAADAKRVVRVVRKPDAVKPEITLRGSDSIQVPQGQAYADSGAVCSDDRDGSLPVSVTGSINTSLRTLQALAYLCADSAGNAAVVKTRKVNVIRAPDNIKPVITLKGPDSLQVFQGDAYVDSGAVCSDDRDGAIPVKTIGSINTALRTLQSLTFTCADSAGNAAAGLTRKVNVARVPDLVKPVATLRGSPVVKSLLGAAYADAGADCVDARDGVLMVAVQGAVNTAKVGNYDLTFTCADSAGNAASPAPVRTVKVLASLDSIAPVITRTGPDTLVAVSVDAVFDPWATCMDAVDGPLTVTRTALPGVGFMGHVQVTYACKDAAFNEATVTRIVKIGLFGTYLPATAECQIDTLDTQYNIGASGSSGFVKEPGGKYFAITRFDLSKVVKTGLKSAKLRYFTFGHNSPWPGGQGDGNGNSGTFANYTFRVYTVKSDWTEGTGNWFWYDNQYQNGGANWYQYYPITPLVKAVSTNPAATTGITGADRAIVRAANINLVTTKTLNLFYGNWGGNPEQVPPPNKLTVVEFDVTTYIKNTNPANDYGFLVKVDGTLPDLYIGWTTKELGDGSYTPRLMLEY